jgi:glucose/arabinose dehydrogenase
MKQRLFLSILVSVCAQISGKPAFAAAAYPPHFGDKTVAAGLTSPTAMAFTPDGRLFVSQQAGAVAVIADDALLPKPLLTLRTDYNTERGLLGVAVDPEFAINHFVYVYYTNYLPSPHNRLSRFTETDNLADTAKETVLIDFPELPKIPSVKSINFPGSTTQAVWHMGGSLAFGADGKLYIGVGEHQQPDSAQKLTNVFGKILRFNPDGTIPEDGPFYATGTGLAKAIWVYGLRNPFTLAVHPKTGRIFANDVGDRTWEEVDEVVKGANFGWKISEGATTDIHFKGPLYTYKHGEGCAVMGGAFYDPPVSRYPPALVGRYFFADFCKGWIRHIDPVTGAAEDFASGILFPTGIKVSPQGHLYYIQRGQATGAIQQGLGKVIKIFDSTATAVTPARPRSSSASEGWVINLSDAEGLKAPPGKTTLRIFDLGGRMVWTASMGSMVTFKLPPGLLRYRWD